MSKMSNWIQLKFGQFLTMWGASIWHRDDVYAIKNNLNERIWRNGQILKFLNPWTFPATESSIMGLPKYIIKKHQYVFKLGSGAMVELYFCMPQVRGSNPTLTKHYFLANIWFFCISVGSNPSQNSHFSTFFNLLVIALRGPLWPSWTTLGGWGAAESGGNWLKM